MSYRKLHMPSGLWTYKVGRVNVVIRDPNGHRFAVKSASLTGERFDADDDQLLPVTPARVRKHIESICLSLPSSVEKSK